MGSRYHVPVLLKASPNHLWHLYGSSKLNGNLTTKPSAKKHRLLMGNFAFFFSSLSLICIIFHSSVLEEVSGPLLQLSEGQLWLRGSKNTQTIELH